MNKLLVTFLMLFFFGTILSGIMEGGGGIRATALTANLAVADTTVNVRSTEGFLASDFIQIGDEKIRYTHLTATTFEVPAVNGRGYEGDAVAHATTSTVYNPEASVINAAIGFNVASVSGSVGAVDIIVLLYKFFTVTVPRLILWDFSWLKEGSLIYLRYVLLVISTGFVVTMFFTIASALAGVAQRLFLR